MTSVRRECTTRLCAASALKQVCGSCASPRQSFAPSSLVPAVRGSYQVVTNGSGRLALDLFLLKVWVRSLWIRTLKVEVIEDILPCGETSVVCTSICNAYESCTVTYRLVAPRFAPTVLTFELDTTAERTVYVVTSPASQGDPFSARLGRSCLGSRPTSTSTLLDHMMELRNIAFVGNTGHFDFEFDLSSLSVPNAPIA